MLLKEKAKRNIYDTLDVATEIYGNGKDTVMTVRNFPVKIFARYIPENAEMKDLKEALKKYEMPVNFKSVVYYLTVTPVIQFMLFPDAITVNLEYGGATHKVKFYCYSSGNSRYTFGEVTQVQKARLKPTWLFMVTKLIQRMRRNQILQHSTLIWQEPSCQMEHRLSSSSHKVQSKRNKEVRNLHLQIYIC